MAAVKFIRRLNLIKSVSFRCYSSQTKAKRGIVLGAFTDDNEGFKLTSSAKNFDKDSGLLEKNLCVAGIKKGKARVFYGIGGYDAVAVVGLGKEDCSYNDEEEIDEKAENVRVAAAVGCRALQEVDCTCVEVEDFEDGRSAAEGATLGTFLYQEFKKVDKRKKIPTINYLGGAKESEWKDGIVRAKAQNLARSLADAPANYMTPTKFAERAKEELCHLGVEVVGRDREWALGKGMGAFLSVAQGSDEPCKFVEMTYRRGPQCQKPILLVGKGVTFDTGGISLKPAKSMDEMRADMGGAACLVGAMQAIASLQLPVNVIALTPLCENMPGGRAVKPGDIVQAKNGKTVQVDNTDAEGRLILADALCHAASFDPAFTLDIATLTGAMRVALGGVASGVFTNSRSHWEQIHKAGIVTGDRVWKFPLFKAFSRRMTEYPAVDVNNVGKGTGGGSCTAAAFLKEFAPAGPWMHVDIAGVMGPDADAAYLQKGMTGRPTRTLIQLVHQLASAQ